MYAAGGHVFQLLRAYPEKIGIVRNWKEIEENWEMKRMSALLTAEEGGICQENLRFFGFYMNWACG